MTGQVLELTDLSVEFKSKDGGWTRVVDEVSFSIDEGETVGLVGESGSGKSVTALAIMGLHSPRATRTGGAVRLLGHDILTTSERQMERIRGVDVAMIFQDPMTSLNPVVTIGRQITEVVSAHKKVSKSDARRQAVELLDRVGIPDPERRSGEYPHQLSGGMRQRALIAIALACEPKLLIADEPTTALDVTIQAQILALLGKLVRETGASLLMITHDLGVVAGICDTVNVMYGGRVVEGAPRREFFAAAAHPYTRGLLASIPQMGGDRTARLTPISGTPNDRIEWAQGCAFAPRCSQPVAACTEHAPELNATEPTASHQLRCFNPITVEPVHDLVSNHDR